jgi:hypothetical protein
VEIVGVWGIVAELSFVEVKHTLTQADAYAKALPTPTFEKALGSYSFHKVFSQLFSH